MRAATTEDFQETRCTATNYGLAFGLLGFVVWLIVLELALNQNGNRSTLIIWSATIALIVLSLALNRTGRQYRARYSLLAAMAVAFGLGSLYLPKSSLFHFYAMSGFSTAFLLLPWSRRSVSLALSAGFAVTFVLFESIDDRVAVLDPDYSHSVWLTNATVGLPVLFFFVAVAGAFYLSRSDQSVIDTQSALASEHQRSEELLHNILPRSIAEELKATGSAEPREYAQVSVMFLDLVDFTATSHGLAPTRLISELNELYTAFDDIVVGHGAERIKTIGDAYLAVTGLPQSVPDHAQRLASVAIDLIGWLDRRNAGADIKWNARIGIHSGAAVAGIVGTRKYQYDVFGDTVNIASRMENHSEPGRINVSAEFAALLTNDYELEPRATRHVKGRGDTEMFWLRAPLNRLSAPKCS